MKKIFSVLFLFILIFSLSACGNNFPKAEAVADPAEINWGSGEEGDRWYLDGKEEEENYLIFTKASTGKDCYICQSVTEGNKSELTCTAREKHLTVPGGIIDIIFPDQFTAYDTVSKTYYSRGNLKDLMSSLGNLVFEEKTDATNVLKLNEDGKCKEKYLGNTYTGTWKLCTPDTVRCTFKDDDFPYEFKVVKDDDGNITGLKQGDQGRRFKVRSTGDES